MRLTLFFRWLGLPSVCKVRWFLRVFYNSNDFFVSRKHPIRVRHTLNHEKLASSRKDRRGQNDTKNRTQLIAITTQPTDNTLVGDLF